MKVEKSDIRKPRRAKTFTGCWTCRSRKVKCDLGRPSCKRCERSGFECGGYDIKLRWSKPIKFDRYGVQLPPSPNSPDSGSDEPQFQRRNIAFVRYQDEYEFYEDMDDELSALHSPPLENIAGDKTWIINKFGVFRGTEKVKKKYVPRKKRKRNVSYNRGGSASSKLSSTTSVKSKGSSSISNSTPTDLFDFDFSSMNFTGHEWISNELRDDALLSASAVQGIPTNTFTFPAGGNHTESSTTADFNDANNASGQHHGQHQHGNQQSNIQGTANGGFANIDPVAEVSQVYRLLSHRNEDKDKDVQEQQRQRQQQQKHDTHQTIASQEDEFPSLVPLNNLISIHAPGGESRMPESVLEIVPSVVPDPSIFNLQGDKNILLRLPTTGLHVHGLARFLLNYYLQNVADLMTVVALPTNPWKTIYFPRALKALGDLAGIGYTSNSRNSLLNALLAVSCFNLQSKFPKNTPQMRFYLYLGIEFRSQASNFLKKCLNSSAHQERYKDILTAILSMNSIDVVWGTMADCQYHLTICEDFVEERMKTRPKISEKAKALHRIFSFLKLIQDSTALDKVREGEIVIKDDEDLTGEQLQESQTDQDLNIADGEFKESLNQKDGKIRIEFVKQPQSSSSGSTPIFTNITSETYYYPKMSTTTQDILSTDALYGLPNSLILCFSDCVRLVRHREYYKMNKLPAPRKYAKLCTEFEKRLLNWKSEWDFYKPHTREFVNDTIEGVYHHTMSFYYSLIIYYFTMARDLNNQLLQSYVEKVLSHLNQLSDLIDHKNVKIVPLIWQGFIAGCSSVDSNLQLSFKKWAAKLASSGMGSYWGARQIMFEVWRRRMNGEENDNWCSVYKDWEMNLMLS